MTRIARNRCRLRPITTEDADLLLGWRNRPEIRQAMFTTGEIDRESHLAWIARMIDRDDAHAFIYEQNARPTGYVKLDRAAPNQLVWGFYIGAPDAPAGSGGRMLFLALETAFGALAAQAVRAEVRAENAASLRIHRKLGFRSAGETPDDAPVRFEISPDDWQRARSALSERLFSGGDQGGDQGGA